MHLSLQNLEQFMTLLHSVERVKRAVHRPGEIESTNTGEHTFELALLCWYIASGEKLHLSQEKILKYALAHDLVEAYSGDTPAYDVVGQQTKAEREHAAYNRIKTDFTEFPELATIIETYEAKADEESRFVYAVDKLIDPLGASLETMVTHWKQQEVTYAEMQTIKTLRWHSIRSYNSTGKSSVQNLRKTYHSISPLNKSNFANSLCFPYNTSICDYLELIMDQKRRD